MTIAEHVLLCILVVCVLGSLIHTEARLDRIEASLKNLQEMEHK